MAIFLGGVGAHHFYLGNIGVAWTQLGIWASGVIIIALGVPFGWVFVAGVLVWVIVDLFQIPAYVSAANSRF